MRLPTLMPMLLLFVASIAHAQSGDDYPSNMPQAPLNERVLQIPVSGGSITLETTLFTPDGPGPFPLAIVNHGSPPEGRQPRDEPRHRVSFAIDYFLSRGYAVVAPMMRGFAGSGGHLPSTGCDYERFALDDADDIRAVIDFMSRQPDVDPAQIVVSGQSFGGWNTLALGSLNPPNVKGLINFVGGMHTSNCADPDDNLIDAAGRFGARTSIPSIWFYGDNDRLFSVRTWRGMYARYINAGSKVELVAFGKFGNDSHQMLSSYEGLRIWTPRVDAFLKRVGLPSEPIYPQYMPIPIPPASSYASLDDVDAVPYLNDQGRDLYRKFLALPPPRAIAIATNGAAAMDNDGFDPLLLALNHCRRSGHPCQLYAVDDNIVWNRPTPAPPATNFAAISDAQAVPYLDDKGRDGYRKFLAFRRPRAFVIAPDGSWNAASMGPDPLTFALEHCGQKHQDCRLYAVDQDVVWPAQ